MRTAKELALLEIATEHYAWEGENDAPTGSFALVTINDDERSYPCENDADANAWLQATEGTTFYVLQQDSNGLTHVTEHDDTRDAHAHVTELQAEFAAWHYAGVESI